MAVQEKLRCHFFSPNERTKAGKLRICEKPFDHCRRNNDLPHISRTFGIVSILKLIYFLTSHR